MSGGSRLGLSGPLLALWPLAEAYRLVRGEGSPRVVLVVWVGTMRLEGLRDWPVHLPAGPV